MILLVVVALGLCFCNGVVKAECETMEPKDTGICARYLSYSDVWVTTNPNAATGIATPMQTFLSTFMDPTSSYRSVLVCPCG
jgi:hypothetical protein